VTEIAQPECVVVYDILDEGIGWQRIWPVLTWDR
jgi:hypothetical protein